MRDQSANKRCDGRTFTICIGVRFKQMQFITGFCQTLKKQGVIFEVDFLGGSHFLRVLHIKMQNVANRAIYHQLIGG